MKRVAGIIFGFLLANQVFAQDTLPKFSVIERSKKVLISWINPYESVIQLNVQRSYDSLRNYRTIYSATSPQLVQNGFSEPVQPNAKSYYRIFYVLDGGAYFFTPARLAVPDTEARIILKDNSSNNGLVSKNIQTVKITTRGAIVANVVVADFNRFKDSILRQTKDTLISINDSTVELRNFIAKEVWKPSMFVFTNKDGYLHISLTDATRKKYHLKFFEENGTPLFEISHIKDPQLTLDKSNFEHAGWFIFELFEENKLKEKNKFYLPKDF